MSSASTPSLALQRCFNHNLREAAARCPECRRFFCRECVAEHDDRVICAACLKKLTAPELDKRRAFSAALMRSIQLVVGIVVAWFFFFIIGEGLLRIPASFHDTSLWQAPWIETK
jgi:hypothetical protein